MQAKYALAAAVAVVTALATDSVAAGEPAALDANLYAEFSGSPTSVTFIVCGSVQESEGCFGVGTMSPPFDQACAVLQGKPKTRGDVVSRAIYVLDKRTSGTADIMLYVYERKDVITASDDTVSVTLKNTVDLGLKGGQSTFCSLAGNDNYVYAATSVDQTVAGMDKKTLAVAQLGGFSPPATVVSITADDRGYVALHFTEGFYLFNPHGDLESDGGGAADLINQRNGWIIQ